MSKSSHLPPVPPLESRLDRFGLPEVISLLGETAADRTQREATVLALLADVHALAIKHLGPTQAQVAWQNAAKGKPGAKKGARDPDQDELILALHDYVASLGTMPAGAVPRHVSQYAVSHKEHAPEFSGGRSAETLETHLRRLLNRRKARDRQAQEAEAVRSSTPSILGSLLPYKKPGGN